MKEEVFICTFSDINYIQHTCVMLKSIALIRNLSRTYSIFFFYSDCSEGVIQKVGKEFENERNFNLSFIECNVYKQYSSKLKLNHSSMAIYAKVFIYDLLPENVKKVLFLDSDIVLLNDPAELFDSDIDNHLVGAVQDFYYKNAPVEMKVALNLYSEDDYFNSGVLLVNVCRWKKEKISEKSIQFMVDHGHRTMFHDQDGFNFVIKGDWERLSPLWNPGSRNVIYAENGETIEITSKEIYQKGMAKLVHYLGSNKPWLYMSDHPMKFHYLNILSKTQFANYIFPDKTIKNIFKKEFLKIKKKIVHLIISIKTRITILNPKIVL